MEKAIEAREWTQAPPYLAMVSEDAQPARDEDRPTGHGVRDAWPSACHRTPFGRRRVLGQMLRAIGRFQRQLDMIVAVLRARKRGEARNSRSPAERSPATHRRLDRSAGRCFRSRRADHSRPAPCHRGRGTGGAPDSAFSDGWRVNPRLWAFRREACLRRPRARRIPGRAGGRCGPLALSCGLSRQRLAPRWAAKAFCHRRPDRPARWRPAPTRWRAGARPSPRRTR
jgi:hypothetical protein